MRQCALRARSDCDEGRACCNVQNAPFLPRVARVSPTRRARDVRVAVRAGCGGGATHRPVSAQLCADSRWRVGGANCGGVGRASYVRNLLCVDLGKCPRTGLANSRGRGAVGGRRGAMPTQRTDSHGARGPRWADAVRAQAGRGAGRAAGGRARRGAGWGGVKADTLPARSQHIPRELFSMHGRERCPRNQGARYKNPRTWQQNQFETQSCVYSLVYGPLCAERGSILPGTTPHLHRKRTIRALPDALRHLIIKYAFDFAIEGRTGSSGT